jgi:hypothetical protein
VARSSCCGARLGLASRQRDAPLCIYLCPSVRCWHRAPDDPHQQLVKRVIGLPGDLVWGSGGDVVQVPQASREPAQLERIACPAMCQEQHIPMPYAVVGHASLRVRGTVCGAIRQVQQVFITRTPVCGVLID